MHVVPVSQGKLSRKNPLPDYVRAVKDLAFLSGLSHDLGKMNAFFQEKIRIPRPENARFADPVRHEWLSCLLLHGLWHGDEHVTLSKKLERKGVSDLPLSCVGTGSAWTEWEALQWAVVTHHRMLGGKHTSLTRENHWIDFDRYRIETQGVAIPKGKAREAFLEKFKAKRVFEPYLGADLPEKVVRTIREYKENLARHPLSDWRGAAILARAALLAADHFWSAQEQRQPDDEVLRANSVARQSLKTHLFGVAGHAQRFAQAFFEEGDLPGCAPQSLENIARPSDPASRFAWQNVAADFLSGLPKGRPTLVFNLAGTGSGKTRANLRCLAALSPEDRSFRVTSVFNLRTLTVQTHRAYRGELGIEDSDMACIVGDPLVRKLSAIEQGVALEDDERFDPDEEIEYLVDGAEHFRVLPQWLSALQSNHADAPSLLMPPILVSTIDYVISAGDFGDTRHHTTALLRSAHRALVLDEVDGYEPAALASVCRAVLMAGLFGRNIVASSATLSRPVALAIQQAFAQGCALRSGMVGHSVVPQYALVDDRVSPSLAEDADFASVYDAHVEQMIQDVSCGPAYRRYRAIPVTNGEIDEWVGSIAREGLQLHRDHHFDWEGVSVSVGLVRMANVRPCVEISRKLTTFPVPGAEIVVTSYHASDMRLRRVMKEQRLDRVLTRKPGADDNPHRFLREDPEIRQAHKRAKAAGKKDLCFVVVATPVEEVGRDHDFDWAILEPSSAQSIVQAAGRVNRHRLMPVERPNVAIFDRNLRSFRDFQNRPFRWPGYEVEEVSAYPHHDMAQLLGKEEGAPIHAGWRIGSSRTRFAQYDDRAIQEFLKDALDLLDRPQMWHSHLFRKYALRAKSGVYAQLFRYDPDEQEMLFVQDGKEDAGRYRVDLYGCQHHRSFLIEDEIASNTFFCPTIEEVIAYAREIGEDEKVSQRFSVTMPKKRIPIGFDLQFGGYGLKCQ